MEQYLQLIRDQTLDNYSDKVLQVSLNLLHHFNDYEQAFNAFMSLDPREYLPNPWTEEEKNKFEEILPVLGKNFHLFKDIVFSILFYFILLI